MRKFVAVLMIFPLLISVIAYRATPVRATVGPFVSHVPVLVDDRLFEMWVVEWDYSEPFFRLRDLAYMLNGTPAQFDIREPLDDGYDVWIVRGGAYTPTGDELMPIQGEVFDDVGPAWFGGSGRVNVLVGVDGTDAPETFVSITVLTDDDDIYFAFSGIAPLLGVTYVWSATGHFFHQMHEYPMDGVYFAMATGVHTPIELPVNPLEFFCLAQRMDGHWVDSAHFYSPIINESVVWPVEFIFSPDGHGVRYATWEVVAAPMRQTGEWWSWLWYPLTMRSLDGGLAELTLAASAVNDWNIRSRDFAYNPACYIPSPYERRIVVDTNQEEINELTYYIGETPHRMVRVTQRDPRLRNARRYYAEPAEGGGIRLLYVTGLRDIFSQSEFRIYRSAVPGERGELVFSQDEIGDNERLLFEFTDTTARRGYVYYYSLWTINQLGGHDRHQASPHGWQMRVDVNAVRGYVDEYDDMQHSPGWLVLLVIVFVGASLVGLFVRRRAEKRRL